MWRGTLKLTEKTPSKCDGDNTFDKTSALVASVLVHIAQIPFSLNRQMTLTYPPDLHLCNSMTLALCVCLMFFCFCFFSDVSSPSLRRLLMNQGRASTYFWHEEEK